MILCKFDIRPFVLTAKKILISLLIMLLGSQVANGQEVIIVESDITQNTTWLSGNTYIISNTINITPTRTLTIQPGVTVLFDLGCRLLVFGNIDAQGTESDSILFAPYYQFPWQDWQWIEIRFQSTSKNNSFRYSSFKNAQNALIVMSGSDIEISNSSFRGSQLGVKLEGEGSEIRECFFNQNVQGVYITGSENSIISNIFRNHDYAVSIIRPGPASRNNVISGNLIENSLIGIRIGRSGINGIGKNIVSQNIIIGNDPAGLLIHQDSTVVSNNIFWSNNNAIQLLKSRNTEITGNTIYENNKGISYETVDNIASVNNLLKHNTFQKNQDSAIIFRNAPQREISFNNIFLPESLSEHVYNLSSHNISMLSNWWGTDNAELINQLIWDYHDDPKLGSIVYEPVLSVPDTTAPVSPPLNAVKRAVDSKIIVSWDQNPEEDIAGYRVYYGLFSNYSFSHVMDAGFAGSIEIPGISLSEPIAVTAYDFQGMETGLQLIGHESAFAFTRKAPFAGNDTAVCKNNGAFHIINASVYEHISLVWSTSGDGTFSNIYELNPIYDPGTLDLNSGLVILTLTVDDGQELQADSFRLEFIPDPVAWAGNDATIYSDSTYSLFEAMANYCQVIQWISSGDGSFDNPAILTPVYTPGPSDIQSGLVHLVLYVESFCGQNSDTMTLFIEQYSTINGRVHAGNNPMSHGVVLAYYYNDDNFRAIRLSDLDQQGEFEFTQLKKGSYYLYAVPDKEMHEGYLPGYYFSNIHWQDAYLIPLTGSAHELDLRLPSQPNDFPDGPGKISGTFQKPSAELMDWDIYGRDWFNDPHNIPSSSNVNAQNVTVLLLSSVSLQPLAFTLTDENGHFVFNDLLYGSYRVRAEKAGFLCEPSEIITLSPDNPYNDNIEVAVQTRKFQFYLRDSDRKERDIVLFPNPVTNILHLELRNSSDRIVQIDFFNSQMQQVLQYVPANTTSDKDYILRFDFFDLPSGIYFCRITKGNRSKTTLKFIKN